MSNKMIKEIECDKCDKVSRIEWNSYSGIDDEPEFDITDDEPTICPFCGEDEAIDYEDE